MKEPAHIKGVLPPSFRAWYQLYNRVKRTKGSETFTTVIWHESHPTGLRQGYEFTLDEIKARVLDELLEGVGNLLKAIEDAHKFGPDSVIGNRTGYLEELCRFLKYRYFPEP